MKKLHNLGILLAVLSVCSSCNKDKIKYDVPATYSFANADFSLQNQQMDMLDEMVAYAEGARVPGTVLNAQHLKDMFHNQNNPFSFAGTQNLSAFATNSTMLESWLDSLANASASTAWASYGVAGLAVSNDHADTFLLDKNGFDYTELIEKGIMGSVFYAQAMARFQIGPIGKGDDVATFSAQWDQGFGYFGLPIDYPGHPENSRYWGEAFGEINTLLHVADSLMAAAILGRSATMNDDADRVTSQSVLIQDLWDKAVAARCIHEFNEAKSHLGDDALRNHEISEAIGFIHALAFNPIKKITDAQIQSLLDSFGSDLYTVTLPTIDNARATLATIYNLNSVKDQL